LLIYTADLNGQNVAIILLIAGEMDNLRTALVKVTIPCFFLPVFFLGGGGEFKYSFLSVLVCVLGIKFFFEKLQKILFFFD